jgi:hypothetical protein
MACVVFQRRGRPGPVRVPGGARAGQALIESCLVLALICLAFFGLFQISQLYAAQDILDYAAARGARAKTVGFNRFMVYKTIRVGAIPNAGRLIEPVVGGGPLDRLAAETPRIPLYLAADRWGDTDGILQYDAWDSIGIGQPSLLADNTLHMELPQSMPFMSNGFHRAYYRGDDVPLTGEATIDTHYSLYMEERNW